MDGWRITDSETHIVYSYGRYSSFVIHAIHKMFTLPRDAQVLATDFQQHIQVLPAGYYPGALGTGSSALLLGVKLFHAAAGETRHIGLLCGRAADEARNVAVHRGCVALNQDANGLLLN